VIRNKFRVPAGLYNRASSHVCGCTCTMVNAIPVLVRRTWCSVHFTETTVRLYGTKPNGRNSRGIWVFWDESRSRTCRTSSFWPISSTDGLLIHCQEARMHHRSEYVEINRATEEARLARSRDPIMSCPSRHRYRDAMLTTTVLRVVTMGVRT